MHGLQSHYNWFPALLMGELSSFDTPHQFSQPCLNALNATKSSRTTLPCSSTAGTSSTRHWLGSHPCRRRLPPRKHPVPSPRPRLWQRPLVPPRYTNANLALSLIVTSSRSNSITVASTRQSQCHSNAPHADSTFRPRTYSPSTSSTPRSTQSVHNAIRRSLTSHSSGCTNPSTRSACSAARYSRTRRSWRR